MYKQSVIAWLRFLIIEKYVKIQFSCLVLQFPQLNFVIFNKLTRVPAEVVCNQLLPEETAQLYS